MSLETSLTSIAKSLELIATYLSTTKNVQTTTIETTHAATPLTPVSVPAVNVSAHSSPAAVVMPVDTYVVAVPVTPTPVAAMPAVPVFTPAVNPVAAPSGPTALAAPLPFNDKQAMMDFVISSYKALGAEKGAKIQDVLTGIGYQNINDVDPARWGDLKAGIEALK